MRLTTPANIFGIDPWSSETAQQLPLGSLGFDVFNNVYRYGQQNSGAAAVQGDLYQGSVIPANFVDLAVAVAAPLYTTGISSQPNKSVSVTLGATGVTSGQFNGARAVVTAGPGIGTQYTVASHTVTASSGTAVFTFEETLQTALTTSSKITLVNNQYSAMVIAPTTPTGIPGGVALAAVPASSFGWYGVHGVFGVLSDATLGAVSNGISPSTTTAGAITKAVTLKDSIGFFITTPVSAQTEPQWININ